MRKLKTVISYFWFMLGMILLMAVAYSAAYAESYVERAGGLGLACDANWSSKTTQEQNSELQRWASAARLGWGYDRLYSELGITQEEYEAMTAGEQNEVKAAVLIREACRGAHDQVYRSARDDSLSASEPAANEAGTTAADGLEN